LTKVYVDYRDNEVHVLSAYDPVLVAIIRDLDIRRFKADTKEWIVGLSEAQQLIDKARSAGFEVIIEHRAKVLNLQ
jgi:hypothetical protein